MSRSDAEAVVRRWGIAWVAMAAALAVHVADEALTGFLPFYNGLVERLRESAPLTRFPTFTFGAWLGGLIVGVAGLFVLSPLAFGGRRGLRFVAFPLSVLMMLNGLGHLAASVGFDRLVPGTLSAPLVFAAAVALFSTTRQVGRLASGCDAPHA